MTVGWRRHWPRPRRCRARRPRFRRAPRRGARAFRRRWAVGRLAAIAERGRADIDHLPITLLPDRGPVGAAVHVESWPNQPPSSAPRVALYLHRRPEVVRGGPDRHLDDVVGGAGGDIAGARNLGGSHECMNAEVAQAATSFHASVGQARTLEEGSLPSPVIARTGSD